MSALTWTERAMHTCRRTIEAYARAEETAPTTARRIALRAWRHRLARLLCALAERQRRQARAVGSL